MAERVRIKSTNSGGEFPTRSWDDQGNAERFVERYGDRVRWLTDAEKWAVYNGDTGLWATQAATTAAMGLMRKTFERMVAEEGPRYTGERGEKWVSWAAKQRGAVKARQSALIAARDTKSVAGTLGSFNTSEHLLHCANGVLDLRTLRLLGHAPTHMMTKTTGVAYDPSAQSREWRSFLRTFLPDRELRAWMQKLMGISLLSGNPEKLILVVKGPGDAGKSSLNSLVMGALGGDGDASYAQGVDLSIFKGVQDATKANVPLANALPARYIASTEAGAGWTLHPDQIKRMTGSDVMSARRMHENIAVRRVPSFTPWIYTNDMPGINKRDAALMNRLMVIPMMTVPSRVVKGKTDRMLADPECLSAVLAWMVAGLERYQEEGLPRQGGWPQAVQKATAESVHEMSLVDAWISERCSMAEGASVESSVLFGDYETWCLMNRVKEAQQLNHVQLGQHLGGLGLVRKVGKIRTDEGRRSARIWSGIELK